VAIIRVVLGPWGLSMPLASFAHVAAAHGEAARAVRLGAAATVLAESYRAPLIPLFQTLLSEGLAVARQALGEEAYAAAWAHARAMTLDEALGEGRALERAPKAAEDQTSGSRLTPSERHVLKLLASGRTTKEIALELVVAVSTVDRHITHIYAKLDVRNRPEATAFALKHGLA
jgi:non-specific serine/threonine protein kinase